MLEEGFFHSLGHGVGLEVHEAPTLERAPDVLVVSAVARRPIHASPLSGRCRPEFTP